MSETTLRQVPLHDVHEALGAKIIDFAGYLMPVSYGSQIEEHLTVRRGVGVFDVSHMGEFYLRGPKALQLIQDVTSNDASKLFDGKAQYSCLPNENGGIVDDLLVYRISEEEYFLVVNASNIEKDWNWIAERNTYGVEMENVSDDFALLAVQGPKAAEALQSLTSVSLADMGYYTFQIGDFAGEENVIISATGYTGAGGFELYVPAKSAKAVWEKVFEAGKDFGIIPVGLAARDTLRMEMGFCLYGNDIDDETSPLEAGLGWITKFTKPFTNSEALQAQKEAGTKRQLTGFVVEERGIPRKGYRLLNGEGEHVGTVTSGTQAPSLGKGIGLAYIDKPFNKKGTELFLEVRKKQLKVTVQRPPFVEGSN